MELFNGRLFCSVSLSLQSPVDTWPMTGHWLRQVANSDFASEASSQLDIQSTILTTKCVSSQSHRQRILTWRLTQENSMNAPNIYTHTHNHFHSWKIILSLLCCCFSYPFIAYNRLFRAESLFLFGQYI